MIWRWATLAALGLYHGANPGMGWLFAVALGLQEKSGRAVMRALPPIALGHAISVGLTVALLAVGQVSVSWDHLKWVTAAVLIGFGILKLVRPRHPRWVGMRVGFRDLTLWSFLMATAHGAGLMLLPVFLLGENTPPCHGPSCHQTAGLTLTSWPDTSRRSRCTPARCSSPRGASPWSSITNSVSRCSGKRGSTSTAPGPWR